MRNRFDKVAKGIGEEALGPTGHITINAEVSPETQHADLRYEPDLRRTGQAAARRRLGLLGQLAAVPCLIEVFSGAFTAADFRACLGKHIAFWQQRTRRAGRTRRSRRVRPAAEGTPFLWIISAGRPTTLLTKLALTPTRQGIYYFGTDVLRVGVVVASELPRTRATLLVRLMAAGPLLAGATAELRALPAGVTERAVAEQILLQFQRFLEAQPDQTRTEREFIKTMLKTWEDARAEGRAEGHAKGRAEGHAKGRVEGSTHTRAHDLLTVLQVRGIHVSAAAKKRILEQKNLKQLERWLKRAIVATSLDEVLGRQA